MDDRFITVATYADAVEAEMARNLLQTEGIPAMVLGGELTNAFSKVTAMGDQISLQVREADAQRAAGLLAAVAAEATLDKDWEEKAETGQDVWICSLCGEPVSNRLSTCYSCQTPREGIRTSRGPASDAFQPPPGPGPGEAIRKRDQVVADRPPPPPAPEAPHFERPADYEPPTELPPGDALARRAFLASLFAVVCFPVFLFLAGYYLIRVFVYPEELSPAGLRYFYWALALTAAGLFLWVGLYLMNQRAFHL